MLRTKISTWLFNTLLIVLVSATATMGMRAMDMPGHSSDIAMFDMAALAGSMANPAGPGSDGLLPVAATTGGKACCACDGDAGCSLERPATDYVLLFTADMTLRFRSLTSQPPAAPPRT